VIEGLLLDRVDAVPARATVGGENHLVAFAGAHEAEATLALREPTASGTDVANHPAVFGRMPVAGGHGMGIAKHSIMLVPEPRSSIA